jgi:hypothetical protein
VTGKSGQTCQGTGTLKLAIRRLLPGGFTTTLQFLRGLMLLSSFFITPRVCVWQYTSSPQGTSLERSRHAILGPFPSCSNFEQGQHGLTYVNCITIITLFPNHILFRAMSTRISLEVTWQITRTVGAGQVSLARGAILAGTLVVLLFVSWLPSRG